MKLPITSGIYTDDAVNVGITYPQNLYVVPSDSGISEYYLRPFMGTRFYKNSLGVDRGGISWRGVHYRVLGSTLYSISDVGIYSTIGDVGFSSVLVKFTYGFDHLALVSNGSLYVYNGSTLQKSTDSSLGYLIDVQWVENFFMVTDGVDIVQMDRDNPLVTSPFSFGAAEIDPDPIVGLMRLRNELVVVGKHTVEYFDFVGGDDFAFAAIDGAQVMKGSIGINSFCAFQNTVAFLGGGNGEPPAVYLTENANAVKISTQEIDKFLLTFGNDVLQSVQIENVSFKNHDFLIIHFPNLTYVYDHTVSLVMGRSVWFTLNSTNGPYLSRNFVWVYDKWFCSNLNTSDLGYLTEADGLMWGDPVPISFSTQFLFNSTSKFIVSGLELVMLTGRIKLGDNVKLGMSFSNDGVEWSQYRYMDCGGVGDRGKRVKWFRLGMSRVSKIFKFVSDSRLFVSFLLLEIEVEGLGG